MPGVSVVSRSSWQMSRGSGPVLGMQKLSGVPVCLRRGKRFYLSPRERVGVMGKRTSIGGPMTRDSYSPRRSMFLLTNGRLELVSGWESICELNHELS